MIKNTLILVGAFAVMVAILSGLLWQTELQGQGFLHFEGTERTEFPWQRCLVLCFAMFSGILCGFLYRRFENTKEIKISLFKRILADSRLWRSLLASPMVFAAIYALSKDNPDLIISSVLAFENGFLSDLVIQKRLKEGSEQGGGDNG